VSWFEFAGPNAIAKHGQYLGWHTPICAQLGIPHPGQNQGHGGDELGDCWTDAYATAWLLVDGRLVVLLDEGDPHAAGLTPTVVNTGDPNVIGDRGDLEGAIPDTDKKPIPPTWNGNPTPPEMLTNAEAKPA
jgi:hypothetical protein